METDNRPSEIPKSRRPRLRWLTYLAIVLSPGLIVFVSRQGWHRSQTMKLQITLTDLDRTEPGWRLADIEAAREKIPEDENSARVVVAAATLLPKMWSAWRELSDMFAHLPPEQQLTAEDLARLKMELEKVRPALMEARKLAALPRGRHRIEYKPWVLDTQMTDQQETWRIVSLLCYDALRHEQERGPISALNSCQAAFHAARSLGDEPSVVSQMSRMDGVILSCQGIERVLAQGEPPPERLAELQDLLHGEDDFPDLLVVTRGTRAVVHAMFDALESGAVPLSRLEGTLPPNAEPALAWSSREELRQSHPANLAAMSRYVTIARLPMHEQPAALKQFDLELRSLKQSDPLAVHLNTRLGNAFDYSQRKHAYLRCLWTALAAERYRRKHTHWPESLDKLCPQFLVFVPLDPFDGQAIRYRRVADGVIIYSVSSDGTDNNGNLVRAQPNSLGVDVGVRLWDAARRCQLPRPMPLK